MSEAALNPLEQFLCDFTEARGGAWDQVEPRVYDLLLPDLSGGATGALWPEVMRVTLDPEALADHPGCRFAGLGTPLLDDMLDAARRGAPRAQAWIVGLGTEPPDLAGRLRRRLELPSAARLRIASRRTVECATLVYWFQATYISDEKEQDTFVVAVDAMSGRQVRHLDRLVDWSRLHEAPPAALPAAPGLAAGAAYAPARERVVRTVASAAGLRRRELLARSARQEARMRDYYAAICAEIDEQIARARRRGADTSELQARRATARREGERRLAELRRKSELRVELSLTNVLEVRQPKLLIEAFLSQLPDSAPERRASGAPGKPAGAGGPGRTARSGAPPEAAVTLLWDPLVEALEAPDCPSCGRPTFSMRPCRDGTWCCAGCDAPVRPAAAPPPRRR